MAEWNEDLHPRDHGKFSSSEGEHGVTDAHRERATASMKDKEFLRANRDRLARASDEATNKLPDDLTANGRYGEAGSAASRAAIHEEIARIHAENDAHGGIPELKERADLARSSAAQFAGKDMAGQHEAVMRAIADHKNEQAQEASHRANEERASAAGHITTEARDIADKFVADHAALKQSAVDHAGRLEQAHLDAATALGQLHAYAPDEEHEHFADTHGLADKFDETHDNLHDEEVKEASTSFSDVRDEHAHDEVHARGDEEEALHPDHPDFEFEHPHPDSKNFEHENLHPDHPDYEFENPHPDSPHLHASDRPKSAEEHGSMLERHNQERADALAAHEVEHTAQLAAHNQERSEALAAHDKQQAERAVREPELRRRAEAAQTALEQLHEHQLAAHTEFKRVQGQSSKIREKAANSIGNMHEHDHVNEEAFSHHETDDAGNFKDPQARKDWDAAHEASESLRSHSADRVDNTTTIDLGGSLNALKDEMRSTAAAIKGLSGYTGRAWSPPKKTKKRAHRRRRQIYTSPDRGAAALAASY